MVKVLTIGTDRNIFKEGSAIRMRVLEYAKLFDELHIVVFTKKKSGTNLKSRIQISDKCFAYPTNSLSRWFYVWNAVKIGKSIIAFGDDKKANGWVIDSQDPFECGLVARRLARGSGAKLHIQIHTDFLNKYFRAQSLLNRLRVWIAGRVLSEADGIRVVSDKIKKSVLGWNKSEIIPEVLPIFVDVDDLRRVGPIYDFRKAGFDWKFIMISVSRLEREKNLKLAIKTLALVVGKYPHAGLAIVGGGRQLSDLKRYARLCGVSGNVAFIGEVSEVSSYLRGANIFFQTSNYEGYGMALVEACASGLPSVTTDVGIASELIKDGINGYTCPVGDEECLRKKIVYLMEDNQRRADFTAELKNNFPNELFPTKEKYLDLYRKSIENCLQK